MCDVLVGAPPAYLHFQLRGFQGWKKRWCMFVMPNGEQPCLHYYKDESQAFSSLPLKRVPLRFCLRVEADLAHSNYKNVFAIHLPERVYYFSAASRVEMIEWAELLCTHLKMSCDLNGQLGLATPPHSPQIRSKTLPVPSLQPPPPGFPVPPVPGGSPHTSPRYSNLSTSPIPSSPLLSNPQRPLPRLPFEELSPPPVPVRRHSPVNTPPLSPDLEMLPPPPPLRSTSASDEGNIYTVS